MELEKLAEIINRRIFHENIVLYEQAALKGENWKDLVLPLESFSIEKIKEAIFEDYNLNMFGKFKGKKGINTDLNMFLYGLRKARLKSIDHYIKVLNITVDVHEQIKLVEFFCETHTTEENFLMKRAFLQKQNYLPEFLNNVDIDSLYWQTIENLRETEENKLHF